MGSLMKNIYPNITEFFANKTIFITGASGFVGKVLVEKLLRSCPDISKIYVLMRANKKYNDVDCRLKEMWSSPAFYSLQSQPDIFKKVQAIKGDINFPEIVEDLKAKEEIIRSTEIVIHNAATVNFQEDLDNAIKLNLLGVKHMTSFCKNMDNLKSMVHVSTAYSNSDRNMIQEKIYQPTIEPKKVLQLYEQLGSKINSMTKILLEEHPNTYTFAKGLAEKYLEEEKENLPISIVRPSIVLGSFNEPMTGWIDSWMGPAGIVGPLGNGTFKVGEGDGKHFADLIPVDMVANCIIAAAWNTGVKENNNIEIYNCANGDRNPIYWGQFLNWSMTYVRTFPFSSAIFYPKFKYTNIIPYLWIKTYTLQFIPAALGDTFRVLQGKKPFLQKMQNRIWDMYEVLLPFTLRTFKFEVKNLERLQAAMTKEERKQFSFDTGEIDWNKYMKNYVLGIRRYLLKEDDSTIPNAKKHMEKLYWYSVSMQCTFGIFCASLLYLISKTYTNKYRKVNENEQLKIT